MNNVLETPQEIQEITSLTEEIERRQVALPPDVRTYLNEETEKLMAKLMKEQDITEEDMVFVGEIRLWIEMPEELQGEHTSIESIQEDIFESKKRRITLNQWFDLLHVAEVKGEEGGWIDETFTFSGGGRIEITTDLDLINCASLTRLPENLEVGRYLYLTNCISLIYVPENLKVGRDLYLTDCISLTHLPESLEVAGDLFLIACTSLTHLPENLKVGGSLSLTSCTSLTHLPENLKVGGSLGLTNCTSLTDLPENLKVGGSLGLTNCTSLTDLPNNLEVSVDLYLSDDMQDQVKKDAERLKEEGKIKGKIIHAQ